MEDPSRRSFLLENVHGLQGLSTKVTKSFIVMSKGEFEKFFSHKRKQKDPSIPSAVICNERGVLEEVYVFKDTEHPFRRLTVESQSGESLERQLMPASSHFHSEQGSRVLHGASERRQADSRLEHILQHGHTLSTLDEYRHKLRKRYSKQSGEAEEDEPAKDAEEGVRDAGSDNEGRDSGDDADGEAWSSEPSSKRPGLALQQASLLRRAASQEFSSSSVKKRKRGDSSASLGGGAGESAPDDVDKTMLEDDDASSLKDLLSIADGKLSDEDKVKKYVHKLDLTKALKGKKMGISKNFATDAIKRGMGATHAAQIRGHLKMVDWAVSLAGSDLESLSADEVREAVSNLQGRIAEWPCSVQTRLWRRHLRQYVQRSVAEATRESVQEPFHEP